MKLGYVQDNLPCCIWYTWWQTCLHNTWHNKCHVLWGWRILCQLDCDMYNKQNIFRAIVESCIPFSSFLQKWNRKNVYFLKFVFIHFVYFSSILFPAFQSHHFDGKVEKTILYKCPLKLSFCLGKIEDTSLENVSRYLHLTTQMQMTAVWLFNLHFRECFLWLSKIIFLEKRDYLEKENLSIALSQQ